jgi:hypothetical protein
MINTSKLAVIAVIAAVGFAVPAFAQPYSFPNISLESFGPSGLRSFSDETPAPKGDKLRVHNRSLYDSAAVPTKSPAFASGDARANYPTNGAGMGSRGR